MNTLSREEAYNPDRFQLGECDPSLFDASKEFRVPETRLEVGSHAVYLWMSSGTDNSFIYPSRIHHIGTDEESGFPEVRFSILNPYWDNIRDVYGLFLNGHFMSLRNGIPFNKFDVDGELEITHGHFTTETGIGLALDMLEAAQTPAGLTGPDVQPLPDVADENELVLA